MEIVKVKKPNDLILKNLIKGKTGTILKGDDFEIMVSPLIAKKIKKAHSKNKGIRIKLDQDVIEKMIGSGFLSRLKRFGRKLTKGIEEPVAKIGGKAVELITGSKEAGKAIESTGRFLLGKDELSTLAGGLGSLGGAQLGAEAAIAVGQPELAPIAGIVGGVVGSVAAKYGTKQLQKGLESKTNKQKKAIEKKQKQQEKQQDKINEKNRKQQEKEAKKKQKEQEKINQKIKKRQELLLPYANRDTSGRLKTFKTTTGADIDPVPEETLFQGTGMKLVNLIGSGLFAEENSGEGIKIKPKKEKMNEHQKQVLDARKSLNKIEEILKSMEGKGLVAEEQEQQEDKPLLGTDPSTYTPNFVIHRADVERNHNLNFKPNRYDTISGSKLLGRMHQGHLSQPNRANHMWKHTLGLPK